MDEECSSNESGWTTYIASSPDQEEDDDDDDRADVEADVDDGDDVDIIEKCCKKEYVEDGDSDDSMASDASSGPTTDQGKSCFAYGKSRVFSHADERKCVGKKKGKDEQMKKVGKEKTGNRGNSAGRSKKV